LLALLVTTAALFALAVVIAVGPDGPARLWLDGGGSSTTLQAGAADGAPADAFTLPGGPAGLLAGATSALDGEVTLASPVVPAERPGAVQLRSTTRVQRRAARTPAGSRPSPSPSRPAPAASTPSPLQPASAPATSAPAPVSSPAPPSSVVKSRGRGSTPESVSVPKQRVPRSASSTPSAAPPASSEPAPRAAPAPAPPMRAVPAPTPAPGTGDSGLTRVPPTHP
jgi:hypothetical protein